MASCSPSRGAVQGVLDLGEVPGRLALHARAQVVVGQALQHRRRLVDGGDDGVERGVDAFDDLAEVALVPGRVGAGRELTRHRGRRERAGVLDQRVDRVDAGVEVLLQRIEVAVVVLGDLRGDRALGDPVHIVGGHVERDDDRVERRVDALDDRAEVALVPGRVGAGRELALHRRVREHLGVGDQQIHRVDAGIEVLFEGVEVAVVAVRDLGRDRPLGDPVHVVGGHVERTDDGVERRVDAFDDAAEVAAVLRGVGTGRELALDRRAREHLRVGDQQVHRIDAGVEVVLDDVEIAAIRRR